LKERGWGDLEQEKGGDFKHSQWRFLVVKKRFNKGVEISILDVVENLPLAPSFY